VTPTCRQENKDSKLKVTSWISNWKSEPPATYLSAWPRLFIKTIVHVRTRCLKKSQLSIFLSFSISRLTPDESKGGWPYVIGHVINQHSSAMYCMCAKPKRAQREQDTIESGQTWSPCTPVKIKARNATAKSGPLEHYPLFASFHFYIQWNPALWTPLKCGHLR
jgi:hypothetical protein